MNGTAGNCMLVVGATYLEELADIRSRRRSAALVPGVGAQGGDGGVMAAGTLAAGTGLVISSSRAILYASSGDNPAAARKAALNCATASTRTANGRHSRFPSGTRAPARRSAVPAAARSIRQQRAPGIE